MGGGDGDDGPAGVTMRPMRPEDVHEAGQVLYDAFSVDSAATGIPHTFTVASPEAGRGLIGSFVSDPSYYHVAAFDGTGKLLGAAFIDVAPESYAHGVGPVFVSPEASNRGIGKALTRAVVEHAQKLNSPSIRLNTIQSLSALGIKARKMEEADVKACGEMFSKGMGFERENGIRAMHTRWPEGCLVAITEDNTVVGYTTGLSILGHTMATSEAAWVAVISKAIQEKEGVVGCVTIPGVYYPRLINWALAAKLMLARHNWYMVIGEYQKPKDGFFWSPGIQL